MVAVIGTTQKYVGPAEDNEPIDAIFSDIYGNPNFVEPFGNGGAPMRREGTLFSQILGVTGVSPGATGNDNVIGVFSLPANTFDIANRGIQIAAQGRFATNTNTKQVKIWFNATTAVLGSAITGGTTVGDSGAQTGSNVGWMITSGVYKYGAAGSNTQNGQCDGGWIGGTHLGGGASNLPMFTTAVESGAIIIAVTGNCTTTATDIVLTSLVITGMC
jgi:hypothetical protein